MELISTLEKLIHGGLGNLAAYLAAHVLLCLLPAFFIAGALSALVPKESVTRFLGRSAPKFIAYPAALLAGSVLAVCSCTIVPLFAGIYKKGAGLGPAIAFLFFAPAANILALAYTGVALGPEFAAARLILSLIFGVSIGLIMALIFSRADQAHAEANDTAFAGHGGLKRATVALLLALVALLIFGTLKLPFLLATYASFTLPIPGAEAAQQALYTLVPFDAAKGEEGVTVQGAILIGLLILIGVTAWRGLGKVDEGYNRWTWVSLGLVGLTLIVAAAGVQPVEDGLKVELTGKLVGVVLALTAVWTIASRHLEAYEVQQWLWETWRFVRQIFPLLVVGVFVVGVIRQLIQPAWVQAVAGSNTLIGNLAGVLFGVFMYFPTLVEVPIAQMFLSLGMHPGPLLAYLMADPELSLQSILMISVIITRRRAWVYAGLVALFSTASGLIFGAWVDGANAWLLLAYLAGFVALLSFGLYALKRSQARPLAAGGPFTAGTTREGAGAEGVLRSMDS